MKVKCCNACRVSGDERIWPREAVVGEVGRGKPMGGGLPWLTYKEAGTAVGMHASPEALTKWHDQKVALNNFPDKFGKG